MEERVEIVKEHLEDGKSVSELAKEHDLGYHLVYDWVKKYKAKGVSGLEDRRVQRTASQEPRTPEEELRVQIAQLERENYLLKLECKLLKKVKEWESNPPSSLPDTAAQDPSQIHSIRRKTFSTVNSMRTDPIKNG